MDKLLKGAKISNDFNLKYELIYWVICILIYVRLSSSRTLSLSIFFTFFVIPRQPVGFSHGFSNELSNNWNGSRLNVYINTCYSTTQLCWVYRFIMWGFVFMAPMCGMIQLLTVKCILQFPIHVQIFQKNIRRNFHFIFNLHILWRDLNWYKAYLMREEMFLSVKN